MATTTTTKRRLQSVNAKAVDETVDEAEDEDEEPAVELTPIEQEGAVESERVFKAYGKSFIWRLPYAMDDLALQTRKAQYLGVAENIVSSDAAVMAYCRAMLDTLCVREPKDWSFNKVHTWGPLIDMCAEVSEWHDTFRAGLAE